MRLNASALFGMHPGGDQAKVFHPTNVLPTVLASPAPADGELLGMDGVLRKFAKGDYLITTIPPTDLQVVPKVFFEEHWKESGRE
jgi:hypothetical protein